MNLFVRNDAVLNMEDLEWVLHQPLASVSCAKVCMFTCLFLRPHLPFLPTGFLWNQKSLSLQLCKNQSGKV